MKMQDLDTHESGNKPITNCLRFLRSCLAQCVSWAPEQREAAHQALAEAGQVMEAELSPNMDGIDMHAVSVPMGRDTPLSRIVRRTDGLDAVQLSRDDLSQLFLHETALLDKLDAMKKVLKRISIRVAFIGWPAEDYWNSSTTATPRWTPDWRDEMELLDAALHDRPLKGVRVMPRETLPWHRIPEEFRPHHLAEGAKRLNQLHLAYLNYIEAAAERQTPDPSVRQLLTLKRAMDQVFAGRPIPMNPANPLHHQQDLQP